MEGNRRMGMVGFNSHFDLFLYGSSQREIFSMVLLVLSRLCSIQAQDLLLILLVKWRSLSRLLSPIFFPPCKFLYVGISYCWN